MSPGSIGQASSGRTPASTRTTAPLAAQAAVGALKVDVHAVHPIENAADGLATLAGGSARGKTVLKIAD